jgi:hypothetical protein
MDDFTQETNPVDIGELVARVYRWDGHNITAAFLAALTEANFHQLRNQIEPLINQHLGENNA